MRKCYTKKDFRNISVLQSHIFKMRDDSQSSQRITTRSWTRTRILRLTVPVRFIFYFARSILNKWFLFFFFISLFRVYHFVRGSYNHFTHQWGLVLVVWVFVTRAMMNTKIERVALQMRRGCFPTSTVWLQSSLHCIQKEHISKNLGKINYLLKWLTTLVIAVSFPFLEFVFLSSVPWSQFI